MAASIGPTERSQEDLDRKLAELDNVPLFMQDMPADPSEDPTLAALQSLVHEGTPDELAKNFKEQGNEYYKGRRFREALGFYTQGIDAKPTDPAVLEALLCNRAACNLELRNYGSVLRDCSKAITANPKCSKAYYRSASALNALEKYEEAIDCCDRCLVHDPGNSSIGAILDKARELKAAKEQKEAKKRELIEAQLRKDKQLLAAYKERNIIVVPNPDASQNPYNPHFDPEDPTNSTLIFPVFWFYPQYATSDVIPEYVETTPFSLHVQAMFPPKAERPDWDKKGDYVEGNMNIYAITRAKRLLKVGKKMTLRDVFVAAKAKDGQPKDGLELRDGALQFVVLPKGEIEKNWIDDYKSNK